MQQLVLLACLVVAVAAEQRFYCSPDSPTTVSSSLTDFYLTTRRPNEAAYSSGLSCEFNAESPNHAFFVEVQSFKLSSAVFTISSGDQVLFSGSSIRDFQTSIMTPSKFLKVRFDATGDQSNSEGVNIRVRALDLNGCPPGWTYLYQFNTCYGTGSVTYYNYFDAQNACNSMRSNLLHVPLSYSNNINTFMRMLPSSLRSSYTWIGLTDRSSRFQHYWLDGTRQFWTSEISCYSDGASSTCYSYERCATFNDRNYLNAIYMDDCDDRNKYACSAPPGGTSNFYRVPNTPYGPSVTTSSSIWTWVIVSVSLFVFGLMIVGIYTAINYRRVQARRMNQGPASVVVSSAQVTIAPPGSYPAQPRYPAPQLYPTGAPSPQFSAAPPSYSAVMAGQANPGFDK